VIRAQGVDRDEQNVGPGKRLLRFPLRITTAEQARRERGNENGVDERSRHRYEDSKTLRFLEIESGGAVDTRPPARKIR
jgi:hypothetical protein